MLRSRAISYSAAWCTKSEAGIAALGAPPDDSQGAKRKAPAFASPPSLARRIAEDYNDAELIPNS